MYMRSKFSLARLSKQKQQHNNWRGTEYLQGYKCFHKWYLNHKPKSIVSDVHSTNEIYIIKPRSYWYRLDVTRTALRIYMQIVYFHNKLSEPIVDYFFSLRPFQQTATDKFWAMFVFTPMQVKLINYIQRLHQLILVYHFLAEAE